MNRPAVTTPALASTCQIRVAGHLDEHRSARLATTIVVELDSTVIGDFVLRVEDAWIQAEVVGQARDTQAELGWVLDPACTGHGYATEAVRELLRYCFEDLGVHRITVNCTQPARGRDPTGH